MAAPVSCSTPQNSASLRVWRSSAWRWPPHGQALKSAGKYQRLAFQRIEVKARGSQRDDVHGRVRAEKLRERAGQPKSQRFRPAFL